MNWENFMEAFQTVEVQAVAFLVGLAVLSALAVWVAVARDRKTVRQILALLDEGREVLDRIKTERESVEWILGAMTEKIKKNQEKERRQAAGEQVEFSLDQILREHGGKEKPPVIVETEPNACGDVFLMPEQVAKQLGTTVRRRVPRLTPEERDQAIQEAKEWPF